MKEAGVKQLQCQAATGVDRYEQCSRKAVLLIDRIPFCLQHAKKHIPRIELLTNVGTHVPRIVQVLRAIGIKPSLNVNDYVGQEVSITRRTNDQ